MRPSTNPKVITANALFSGEVVYLSQSGDWVVDFSDARLFHDASDYEARLKTIQQFDTSIVGADLAMSKQNKNNRPEPVHFREVFRATGPSNRFIGKQFRTSETV